VPPPLGANDSGSVQPISDDDDEDASETSGGSLKETVRVHIARIEREMIVKALEETGGNVTQAARKLEISRKSLQMKMKEFGLRDREG
jgi:DNA-binding NtrC family response regulator